MTTDLSFPRYFRDGSVHSERIIESTTTLYRDREIHPSVKDLQSTTRLAESWKLHFFDTRVDFPVPVQVVVDYFSPIPFKRCKNPLVLL